MYYIGKYEGQERCPTCNFREVRNWCIELMHSIFPCVGSVMGCLTSLMFSGGWITTWRWLFTDACILLPCLFYSQNNHMERVSRPEYLIHFITQVHYGAQIWMIWGQQHAVGAAASSVPQLWGRQAQHTVIIFCFFSSAPHSIASQECSLHVHRNNSRWEASPQEIIIFEHCCYLGSCSETERRN